MVMADCTGKKSKCSKKRDKSDDSGQKSLLGAFNARSLLLYCHVIFSKPGSDSSRVGLRKGEKERGGVWGHHSRLNTTKVTRKRSEAHHSSAPAKRVLERKRRTSRDVRTEGA